MEQNFNVGVMRPRLRHQPVRAKRPAVVDVSRHVVRLASVAAKALRQPARQEHGFGDAISVPPSHLHSKSQIHPWRSKLWRLARRGRLPPQWTFAQLWVPLIAVFMVAVDFVRKLRAFQYVQFVPHAVANLQFAELLATCGFVTDQSEERVVCRSRVYKPEGTPPGACRGGRERLGRSGGCPYTPGHLGCHRYTFGAFGCL